MISTFTTNYDIPCWWPMNILPTCLQRSKSLLWCLDGSRLLIINNLHLSLWFATFSLKYISEHVVPDVAVTGLCVLWWIPWSNFRQCHAVSFWRIVGRNYGRNRIGHASSLSTVVIALCKPSLRWSKTIESLFKLILQIKIIIQNRPIERGTKNTGTSLFLKCGLGQADSLSCFWFDYLINKQVIFRRHHVVEPNFQLAVS